MNIEIKILNKEFYSEQDLPKYQTDGSAALDLVCTENLTICPGETRQIKTGLAVWIGSKRTQENKWLWYNSPEITIAGIIVPRSGLGTKGLVLANTIGVIDEDYQGEIILTAWNRLKPDYPDKFFNLKAGDRIAQLMFMPVVKTKWQVVDEFSDTTQRGIGGFGSTGI